MLNESEYQFNLNTLDKNKEIEKKNYSQPQLEEIGKMSRMTKGFTGGSTADAFLPGTREPLFGG